MGFVIYFAVLALIAAIGILLYNYNKKKYSVCVQAVITQCDEKVKRISNDNGSSEYKEYFYTCEYYYQGQKYTYEFSQGGSFQFLFVIGQKTDIYIDPDRPDKALLSHTPDKVGIIILLSIVGLLALAGLAILALTLFSKKIGTV